MLIEGLTKEQEQEFLMRIIHRWDNKITVKKVKHLIRHPKDLLELLLTVLHDKPCPYFFSCFIASPYNYDSLKDVLRFLIIEGKFMPKISNRPALRDLCPLFYRCPFRNSSGNFNPLDTLF